MNRKEANKILKDAGIKRDSRIEGDYVRSKKLLGFDKWLDQDEYKKRLTFILDYLKR